MILSAKYKHLSIVNFSFFLLTLAAFLLPFGIWQEAMLLGLTAPKLFIPLAFLAVVFSAPRLLTIDVTSILILLFIFSITPSLIISGFPFVGVYVNFIGYFILALLVASVVKTSETLNQVLKMLYYGLTVVSFFALMAVFTSFDMGVFLGKAMVQDVFGLKRLIGTEENPNGFALYYIAALPLSYYFYQLSTSRKNKSLHFSIGILFLLCLLFTVSRGALLGSLIAIIFLVAYQNENFIQRWGIILVLPIVGLVALNLPTIIAENASLFYDLSEGDPTKLIRDKEVSSQNKFDVLVPYQSIFSENIAFGVGYGNLGEASSKYDLHQESAHNIFLGIGLEYGIFALIFYVAILSNALLALRKKCLIEKDKNTKRVFALILGILLGFSVNGLVHEAYINFMFWLFIALGAAAIKLQSPRGIIRQYH